MNCVLRRELLLCMLLFLILSFCGYAQAYTREEQDTQVSMMNYPAYQGPESAVAAFMEEKRTKEWEEQNARDWAELQNRNNNDDVKPKYDNLKDRYENDDAFNMGVNFTIAGLIMAFILSLFAGFVGLSQKALWFFMGVVVAGNVLCVFLFSSFGDQFGINSFIVSFIVGIICFSIVQFNDHQQV